MNNIRLCGRNIILVLVNFSLIILLIQFAGVPVPVQAQTLTYQRTITITNSSGSTRSNYQILATFDTATLISQGKMRSDCGDIRVFDTNGTTALTHWVEAGTCNSTTTKLWVRITSLATGTRIIFLRYGNPSLTSLGNPSGTMDLYAPMTTAPSCTRLNDALYDSVNQWVRLTRNVTGISGQCEFTYNPGTGFYAQFEFWAGGGDGADGVWLYAYSNVTPTAEDIVSRGYAFTYDEFQDRICFTKSTVDNGPGIGCGAAANIDNSTWRTARILHSVRNTVMFMDDVEYVNATDNVTVNKGSNRFGIAGRTGGSSNEHRFRNFFVAKYHNQVTTSVGPELLLDVRLSLSIRNSADTADTNLCDLGTATATAVRTCSYRLKVTTNASNGYSIYMRASGNLTNGTSSITNANPGSGGNLISNATAGVEMYGAVINPGTITGPGTISITNPFLGGGGGLNAVRYNYTTNQTILQSTGPNQPGATDLSTSLITHQLNINNTSPPGFYTQSITYGVIPSF